MHQSTLFWAMADALRLSSAEVLVRHFGSLDAIPRTLSASDLKSLGIHARSAESIAAKIASVSLDKPIEIMMQKKISVISLWDPGFPQALKTISDPPLFLFYIGNLQNIPRRCIAVVGTRSPSADGRYTVQKILPPLVCAGVGIVSGLAVGIDAIAHQETLAHGGVTIAFLGSGLDRIYPSSHQALSQKIAQTGVVFSEFPLGTPPDPYNFPRRNRLVSGLCEGVLVVEGKIKSGSLITAEFAAEQGKEVFAVPGSIRNPLSEGPHSLIRQGAMLVEHSEDIAQVLNIPLMIASDTIASPKELGILQQKIFSMISHVPVPFDALQSNLEISSSELSSELMMMTLLGVVEEVGGGMWIRR